MRYLVPLIAAFALVAGCGTDTGERASASSDAAALLRATVANTAEMRSAVVDLKVSADPSRGDAVAAQLQGPFEVAEQAGELPRFSLTATMLSGGRTEMVGATYTGEDAFAMVDGTAYEIPQLFAGQIAAGLEQATQSGKSGVPLLAADVARWVPSPRNEGLAKVGGVDTVKITGAADVSRVLADVETLLARVRAMNVPGLSGKLPSSLPADAASAVKDLTVNVYTGADDQVLRRLVVTGTVAHDAERADVLLDLTLTDVGAEQQIVAPENARPFGELLKTR